MNAGVVVDPLPGRAFNLKPGALELTSSRLASVKSGAGGEAFS